MADPINPSRKRVVKKTDIKSSDKKSTLGTETKTVYRKDRVTPKKVVTTDYANYYTPKGGMMGGSTVLKKEKKRFDRSGNLKSTTTLTPIKKVGGATDENCWPGKPGCGHKRANRVNNRRAAASKIPVGKIIGGVAAGVLGGLALKNKDKIKEKLGIERDGGSIKKLKKAALGMSTEESCGPGRPKCGKTRTLRGKTTRSRTGPAPGRTWMSSMSKGGSVAKRKK
jgi:hypothetical protein